MQVSNDELAKTAEAIVARRQRLEPTLPATRLWPCVLDDIEALQLANSRLETELAARCYDVLFASVSSQR